MKMNLSISSSDLKTFGLKAFILGGIVLGMTYFLCLITFRDGSSIDKFYAKLSSEKTNFLAMGTSRALYGLNPDKLFGNLEESVINYAFTMSHSPYGKIYKKALEQKLNKETNNGIFILEVSPLSLSFANEAVKSETDYRENELMLNRLFIFNGHPNLDYLLRMTKRPLYQLIWGQLLNLKDPEEAGAQYNGWYKAQTYTDKERAKNIERGMKSYNDLLKKYVFSIERLKYLKETIELLKSYGKVFLVRLPISNEMAKAEKESFPNFDKTITELTNYYKIPYLNYIHLSGNYKTTDQHHLEGPAANLISEKINQDMLPYLN